ncbi:MAG: hypothetical protein WCH09_00350 [Bacteroidota bacterium]
MLNDKKLDTLVHNDAYLELLNDIYAARESLIQELHQASSEQIQQISGRILQCDEVLTMAGYEKVVQRRQVR